MGEYGICSPHIKLTPFEGHHISLWCVRCMWGWRSAAGGSVKDLCDTWTRHHRTPISTAVGMSGSCHYLADCGPAQVSPIWEPCTPHLTRLSIPRPTYSIVQTIISDTCYGRVSSWSSSDGVALEEGKERWTVRSGASSACAPSHCPGPSSSATPTANLPSHATSTRTGHTTAFTSD
jgi:hypothetical protein